MRGLRRTKVMVTAAVVLAIVLSGCDVMLLKDWDGDDDYEQTSDPSLFAVTTPSGGEYYAAGDVVTVEWDGDAQPDYIDIDLYRSGEKLTHVTRVSSYGGSYYWTIPSDLDTATEVADEYQIVASGFHPDYPQELVLAAYSGFFTIEASGGDGLSDVTVNSRTIDITLTDDGSVIDSDTIDLYLNGTLIVNDHVLAEAGTVFSLLLEAGTNTLEVYAVNEGSVSPNTALLEMSNVTTGAASQQWRLSTGEWGSLVITAP